MLTPATSARCLSSHGYTSKHSIPTRRLSLWICCKNCSHSTQQGELAAKRLWSTHSESSPLSALAATRSPLKEVETDPSLSVWHDPADEPVCEVPFDFSFEREDSTQGMRNLIVDEVRSFRHLVRQHSVAAPQRQQTHELPPAPPAPAQPGAGTGPAYSTELEGAEIEEPSSALERQLGQQRIA